MATPGRVFEVIRHEPCQSGWAAMSVGPPLNARLATGLKEHSGDEAGNSDWVLNRSRRFRVREVHDEIFS